MLVFAAGFIVGVAVTLVICGIAWVIEENRHELLRPTLEKKRRHP